MTLNANAQQASAAPAPIVPVYREVSDRAPAPTADSTATAPAATLGSTQAIGLCPHCGSDQLGSQMTAGENAMPLMFAGIALGVVSIPFMLVTIVGVLALLVAVAMVVAPLLMKRQSTVCAGCQRTI